MSPLNPSSAHMSLMAAPKEHFRQLAAESLFSTAFPITVGLGEHKELTTKLVTLV